MTVLSFLLLWASLHTQYAIYLKHRRRAVAEDTESNRSETRTFASQ